MATPPDCKVISNPSWGTKNVGELPKLPTSSFSLANSARKEPIVSTPRGSDGLTELTSPLPPLPNSARSHQSEKSVSNTSFGSTKSSKPSPRVVVGREKDGVDPFEDKYRKVKEELLRSEEAAEQRKLEAESVSKSREEKKREKRARSKDRKAAGVEGAAVTKSAVGQEEDFDGY